MNELSEKNNLAYLLNEELLKTVEEFMKKCPKAAPSVILGAGSLYITGFLVCAPTKEKALETLDSCVKLMRNIINMTPDDFFGDGIRQHFNPNQN